MYVKDICRQHGFKKIALITSAYHMPRAVDAFKKAGFEVLPYPTESKYKFKAPNRAKRLIILLFESTNIIRKSRIKRDGGSIKKLKSFFKKKSSYFSNTY